MQHVTSVYDDAAIATSCRPVFHPHTLLAGCLLAIMLASSTSAAVLWDDFTSFDTSMWGEMHNVPLGLGLPQLLAAGRDSTGGTECSVLFMQSTLDDREIRGIGAEYLFPTNRPLSFEVRFLPQIGGIDGALQLWLTGDTPGKNVVINVFAADYGETRFVSTDYNVALGQVMGTTPNYRYSEYGLWDFDSYYRYVVELMQDDMHLAFLRDDGQELWSCDYQMGLSNFGTEIHVNLSQYMYVPGWRSEAKVLVDYVRVTEMVPEPASVAVWLLLVASGFSILAWRSRSSPKQLADGPCGGRYCET